MKRAGFIAVGILLVVLALHGIWTASVYYATTLPTSEALDRLEMLAAAHPFGHKANVATADILWQQARSTGNVAWIGMARDQYQKIVAVDPAPEYYARYAWLRVVSGR